jgi:hypothetical protein
MRCWRSAWGLSALDLGVGNPLDERRDSALDAVFLIWEGYPDLLHSAAVPRCINDPSMPPGCEYLQFFPKHRVDNKRDGIWDSH